MSEAVQPKKGLLGWYLGSNLLLRISLGLLLGAAVGIALGFSPDNAKVFVSYTKFFGDVFINLLKMIVVPTIFLSLITGAASITPEQLGKVGLKTLIYYMVTSVIAIAIGLALANVFQPGAGLGIVGEATAAAKVAAAPSLNDVLLAIIPTNPVASLAKGDVLPIIFFALLFGIALSILRESKDDNVAKYANDLYNLVSVGAETMYKIVGGVMQYAPIGIFVLISGVFATQGPKVVGPLMFFTMLCYAGFIAHLFLGYGGLMAIYGLNIFKFLKGAREASITAFVTRSSNATLPITMRVTEENLGAPRSISAFALPIGATVNMDGTAIYLSVGAMFIGNAVGLPLGFDQQLSLMIVATLAAIGAAGVPGAGAIMMLMVLETVGLPVTAGSAVAACYAMILGIDALLDMGRTCMNVTGDISGVVIVAKTENELDMTKWA